MKKKILVIGSLVVILAMLAIGGTLAWFSDNDSATNTFTVGSVKIDQIEEQYVIDAQGNKTTAKEEFEDNKVLMPIVNVQNPAACENYLDKIVTVKSNGNNPAYVRTHIAIPTVLKDIIVLDISDSTKWVPAATETVTNVDGMSYTVYSFTYTEELNKDEITDVLLEGVYMKAEVDIQENAQGVLQFCTKDANGAYVFYNYDVTSVVEVLVATQGCQSQGFENAQIALDTVFGAIPNFEEVQP